MRKALITILMFLSGLASLAQDTNCVSRDGIPFEDLENPYTAKKWRMVFAFDGRVSYAFQEPASLSGIKIGAQLNNRHEFGLGIYSFKSASILRGVEVGEPDADPVTNLHFTLSYVSLYYEYIWWRNMRWEISTPLHYATSNINVQYMDTTRTLQDFGTGNYKAPLVEISAMGQYKLLRWLKVQGGLGYRAMLIDEQAIKDGFNSIIYKFGVGIGLGEIWHAMNKNKEKHAVYNEYWNLYKCSQKNK